MRPADEHLNGVRFVVDVWLVLAIVISCYIRAACSVVPASNDCPVPFLEQLLVVELPVGRLVVEV